MAAAGITGPAYSLTESKGYLACFAGRATGDDAAEAFSRTARSEITRGSSRTAAGAATPPRRRPDALRQGRGHRGRRAWDRAGADVASSGTATPTPGRRRPSSSCRYSLPFQVALALTTATGTATRPTTPTPRRPAEACDDSDVAGVARRITIVCRNPSWTPATPASGSGTSP
ncbi:hypothetical protein HBB16_12530 [Pseudonocardia sp. MCCB 268]|nr:hypothetical protein [Pseudonocardia cytotoxica]